MQEHMDITRLVLVPDDAQTINQGIARANELDGVVLVRPGRYREAIRMTANVSVCGLGARGAVVIAAPGWEPALGWGGFQVGATKARGFALLASSAGAHSQVCGLQLIQRNQSQQTAVYCTFGTPTVAHCDIHGSVYVAGGAACPTFQDCLVTSSRSTGFSFVDHARGTVHDCRVLGNRLQAIAVATTARPVFNNTQCHGNGCDDITVWCGDDADDDGVYSLEETL